MAKLISKILVLIAIVTLSSGICHAQKGARQLSKFDRATDSLAEVAEKMYPDDTAKLKLLKLVYERHYNPTKKLDYALKASELASQLGVNNTYIDIESAIAWLYFRNKDYDNAVNHSMLALNKATITNDSVRLATCYNIMANIKETSLDYVASDLYRQHALRIYEKIADDPFIIAKTYRELAKTSIEFQLFDDGKSYIEKAMELDFRSDSDIMESDQLANLADDYILLSRLNYLKYTNTDNPALLEEAKRNITRAHDYAKDADDITTQIASCNTLCHIILEQSSICKGARQKQLQDSAMRFFEELKELSEGFSEPAIDFDKEYFMAKFLAENGDFENSLKAFQTLEPQVEEFDTIYTMLAANFYRSCARFYSLQQDYENEVKYRKKEFSLSKRTYNREFAVKTAKSRLENNFEELSREREEVNNMFRTRILWIVGAISVALIIIGGLWLKNRNVNKQLTSKKSQLEEANTQITSSIRYALKIQRAVVPSQSQMDAMFGKCLIYWKPLNIVSGDFFWSFEAGQVKMLAVADCTGHGVPGAFLSMLGISSLNDIVSTVDFSEGDLEASLILDILRGKIISSLHQTGQFDEAHDGMDMGFLILDSTRKQVQYAGAYRPLLFIRNGELKQYNADRMPISYWAYSNKDFTNHIIDVEPGDLLYLFSDGITDQFGNFGGQEVKYSLTRFKKLLLANSEKPFDEQRAIIEKTMRDWTQQSQTEQIDDQLVVGIRIE